MTKILTFSNDIIGRGEELIINREQAKGIIKELEQDYIPKAVIKLEIAELKAKNNLLEIVNACKEDIENNNNDITAVLDLKDLKSLKLVLDNSIPKEKNKNRD